MAHPAPVPLKSGVVLTDPVEAILRSKGGEVFTVTADATVLEALQALASHEVGALPVLEGRELVGLFSERDYARKVILMGRSSRETRVREVMTRPAASVTPDTTVAECMRLMTEERVRHLPVLALGQLVGIVSIGDLVNWIIAAQEHTIRQLQEYIGGGYPG
jgi:CBS domain-containing protein